MCIYFQLLITMTAATLLTNASPLENDNTEVAPLETDNTEVASLEDIDLNTVAASVNTTDTDELERRRRSLPALFFYLLIKDDLKRG